VEFNDRQSKGKCPQREEERGLTDMDKKFRRKKRRDTRGIPASTVFSNRKRREEKGRKKEGAGLSEW